MRGGQGQAWLAGAVLIGIVWFLFPPLGMICAGIMAVDRLIWLAIQTYRIAHQRQQNFRYLEPLEQALRHGSRGFALMVFAALALFVLRGWLHGWGVVAGVLPAWIALPAATWLPLACAVLFLIGAARFFTGVRMSAGARDALRWLWAAVRCAAAVAALVYFMRADVFAHYGAMPAAGLAGAAGFSFALWVLLVALTRLLLLSWPRGWAFGLVDRHIRDTEFSWSDESPRRRWWQFWKGPMQ
jgi:hypothetical protein